MSEELAALSLLGRVVNALLWSHILLLGWYLRKIDRREFIGVSVVAAMSWAFVAGALAQPALGPVIPFDLVTLIYTAVSVFSAGMAVVFVIEVVTR